MRDAGYLPDQQQEQTMLGDYSSINDHLETARKHADQAETEAKPELIARPSTNLSRQFAC